MENQKRERRANFNTNDRSLLIKLANMHKSVIENKKTDGTTGREKEETWRKIEIKFNSTTSGPPRTAKQLKFKYDSIKKELKKQYSEHSTYLKGTGGGKYIPIPSPKTEEEKELLGSIALSIQGLKSTYDTDAIAGVSGIKCDDVQGIIENEIETSYVEADWNLPNTQLLQTPVHSALQSEEIPVNNDHNYVSMESPRLPSDQKWESRRRPVLNKKKSISSAASKFENLAEKKLELVNIEMEIALEKKIQNQKEQEKRMVILELEEIEHNLKIELLKKSLMRNGEGGSFD